MVSATIIKQQQFALIESYDRDEFTFLDDGSFCNYRKTVTGCHGGQPERVLRTGRHTDEITAGSIDIDADECAFSIRTAHLLDGPCPNRWAVDLRMAHHFEEGRPYEEFEADHA